MDTDAFALEDPSLSPFQNYREKWSRLTGYEFSGLHWNQFIVIYVNQSPEVYAYNYTQYIKHFQDFDYEEEEEEASPDFREYPVGSAFLKEHFEAQDGKPSEATLLTMMVKREPGYDPEYGNWEYFWADGVTGELVQRGKSDNKVLYQSCIECHENMKDRDFVFSTFLGAEITAAMPN